MASKKIPFYNRPVLFLLSIYRSVLSPLKGFPTCRFQPCCSVYAQEAYRNFGFVRASLLVIWRILRCNPFYRGSLYDPLPESNSFKRVKIEGQR